MGKSSKSPSPEFLAKRREAIIEMARKRRKQTLLRQASGISAKGRDKMVAALSLPASVSPPTHG